MATRWRTQTTKLQSIALESCWRPMEGDIAGDFHEVVDLRDGRVGIVVGDAPGYGRRAAAIAETLRSELRKAFQETDEPTRVLEQLESTLEDAETIPTAVCLVLDPVARTVEIANAGHLPLLACNHQGVEFLAEDADPPLGVTATRRTTLHALANDTTLFLYTDGLLERRGTPISESLAVLHDTARSMVGAVAWASELARRMTERFGQPTDDATVLSLRLDAARSSGETPAWTPPRPEPERVELRVYVDADDLRTPQTVRVVQELAARLRGTLEIGVEVLDVHAASPVRDGDAVLATPMIVRAAPGPVVRVIGGLTSPAQLARSLQLPVPEEDA